MQFADYVNRILKGRDIQNRGSGWHLPQAESRESERSGAGGTRRGKSYGDVHG